MARTVAEHLVDTLAQAGVRQIYGVVGDSLNPVTDALRRKNTIKWVDVRHEESGAYAAGAEAQLTGKLSVCAGSCGPGNLHLINGLFDAHRSAAPVLAIAAHIPSSEIGTGYFQETHPDQLFRECSHYCELISNPLQAPRVVQSAIQHAVSKRGVSVIVLPGDVAALEEPANGLARGAVTVCPQVRPCDEDLGQLGRSRQQGEESDSLLRCRLCRAHDEVVAALPTSSKRPVGYSFSREGMDRTRQSERCRHDGTSGLGRCLQGNARLRRARLARHRFSLRIVLADQSQNCPGRRPGGAAGPPVGSLIWGLCGDVRRGRFGPVLPCCSRSPIAHFSMRCCRNITVKRGESSALRR